jgi:hypothetical protein
MESSNMKQLLFIPLILSLVILTGCPYSARESLDDGDGSYTETGWLPGKWVCMSGTDSLKEYKVSKLDKMKGWIMAGDKKIQLSRVGKSVYASVYDTGEDGKTPGYLIMKLVKVNNKEIILKGVTEAAMMPRNGRDKVRAYLLEHDDDERIFLKEDVVRYVKR